MQAPEVYRQEVYNEKVCCVIDELSWDELLVGW